VNFKLAAVFLVVVGAIAGVASFFLDAGYWFMFFIVTAALLVNGFIATVEDDLLGGFNNPDGTDTPRYISVVTWVVRATGLAALGLTVFMLALWRFG
jgi:hypothetical protein